MIDGKMNSNLISNRDLRNFGLIIGFIIGLIIGFVIPYYKESNYYPIPLLIGITTMAIGIIYPTLLKGFYIIWMKLGSLLGFINTRIILGCIYIVLFVPVGLLRRVLQKDSLLQNWDQSSSYWIQSEVRETNHFERPF